MLERDPVPRTVACRGFMVHLWRIMRYKSWFYLALGPMLELGLEGLYDLLL